jgi:hypothetical protein
MGIWGSKERWRREEKREGILLKNQELEELGFSWRG